MKRTSSSPVLARRVVTGLNAVGKSVVVSDGPVPSNARWFKPGQSSGNDLWVVPGVPADLTGQRDTLHGYSLENEPPLGGITARIIVWEPGFSYPIHRTQTIDFVFIISGRLELLLEDGSTQLGQGDCVIQRGTNHGWRVVGNDPCTLALILISAIS